MDFDTEQEMIDFLLSIGAIDLVGYDDDGQEIYLISEKANEVFPSIAKLHEQEVNSAIFNLWKINMINVNFDENGEPLISLNENSLDEDKVNSIKDEELRKHMTLILAAFSQNNR